MVALPYFSEQWLVFHRNNGIVKLLKKNFLCKRSTGHV
ncbi:hypothetical protein UUU_18430 [Klebsiella pneumoniae subsp. pneumoniae DSM 30104 = JCM 1662 = NBRC 14940]|nr:hypothetical protein UUU_18430 [Klebsiella pneumoniae subsp. pneumoniae DSM 30104 = JCM 1662 = NBRC 14940]